jgi:hypothetical protein
VGLVDDEGVVGLQQGVGLGFGQQDTVGHEFDGRVFAQAVLKPDLETHHLAQRRLQFLGDALGHRAGRNAPGLGVADHAGTFAGLGVQLTAPQRQRDFGQLGGFARAGFAADDDDLVLVHGGHDFVTAGRDGQALAERGFDLVAQLACSFLGAVQGHAVGDADAVRVFGGVALGGQLLVDLGAKAVHQHDLHAHALDQG